MSYWLCHWQNRFWKADVNREGERLSRSYGNMFKTRDVRRGDIVYIVSLREGVLLLGGTMTVATVGPSDRKKVFQSGEMITGREGTRLDLHRGLMPDLAREIRYLDPKGVRKPLHFIPGTDQVYGQATRNLPEIDEASANILDRVIAITDSTPITKELRLISSRQLATSTRA